MNATYQASYESIKATSSSRGHVGLAITLSTLLISVPLLLVLVPWQQSVSGYGKVMVLSPMQRPQNIESPISGRLKKWYVQDGQFVKEGELIAELSEVDPKFLDPQQSARLQGQRTALIRRREAARTRYSALQKQLASLKKSQDAAVPSAGERAEQAGDRIWAAKQAVDAAKQNAVTAALNLDRIKALHDRGLRSKRDFELAELDHTRAQTEVERAQAALAVAKRDSNLAVLDRHKVAADTDAAMSNVAATMASAEETIESTSSEIFKIETELQSLSQRIEQRKVCAPADGKIVRLLKVGAGETVDAGTLLAVIAPQTDDLAAELTISDNDAPLVSIGRPVRLQFAGWPALQFSGWPSIAVGTFGGRVAVIDPVDDGRNNYRVIVKPDYKAIEEGRDEPWPTSNHLRPGAEVNGWIMLDTVSLGMELWRQFNAFPPTIKPEELGLHSKSGGESTGVKRKSK